MGSEKLEVTAEHRYIAKDILRDLEITSEAAKALGKDVGAAVEQDMAVSIANLFDERVKPLADAAREAVKKLRNAAAVLRANYHYHVAVSVEDTADALAAAVAEGRGV